MSGLDFEKRLNEVQYRAVTHTGSPLVVFAGAGSGKTRVVVSRMAWLIEERGFDPEEIIALTFTNRAADEMEQRVVDLLRKSPRDVETETVSVTTFHTLGARILRRYASRARLGRNFDILDREEQLEMIEGVAGEHVEAGELADYIRVQKHRGRLPGDRADADGGKSDRWQLYGEYQRRLRRANCVDFGDLLVLPLELLGDEEGVAERYSERWSALLVDEFQDTNRAQYRLLGELGVDSSEITVVGDDDQSIYGWRGATPKNLLDFQNDFEGAETIPLERNYRSSASILAAAQSLIEEAPDRYPKQLWTERPEGPPVRYFTAGDGAGESEYVAERIEELLEADGEVDDAAVIYRTNAQSRHFERALRDRGIPFDVYGGAGFYERSEIRDVLAYLKVSKNPRNEVALFRILNRPRRGIGAVTQQKLGDALEQADSFESTFELIRAFVDEDLSLDEVGASRREIKGRPERGLEEFVEVMDSFRGSLEAPERSIREAVRVHLERIDYFEYLQSSYERGAERRRNVEELLGVLGTLEKEASNVESGPIGALGERDVDTELERLDRVLERLALVGEETEDGEGEERVALMTAHSVKGLEFDAVFVVGLEDRLFPHERSVGEDRDRIHEERRLLYVAMTRAKEYLFLTNARRRNIFGTRRRTRPSRFILESDLDGVDIDSRSRARSLDYREQKETWGTRRERDRHGIHRFPSYEQNPDSEPSTENRERGGNTSEDLVGSMVTHSSFGIGEVKEVSRSGERTLLRVRFPTAGEKTICRRYVKIHD